MKEYGLQIKYSLSQFLFWVTSCTCSGFIAVYLQYKGLSNTLVGLVVGLYGFLALFGQPLAAKLATSIPCMTVRRMVLFLMAVMAVLFAVITVFPVPLLLIVVMFVLINALSASAIPIVNTWGMEYINHQRKVNFGVARGIGSMGWATSAVLLGFLCERFNPDILGIVYVIATICLLVIGLSMEDVGLLTKVEAPVDAAAKKDKGLLRMILSDRIMMGVIIGLFCVLSCHSIATIYTINIVRNVGGTEFTAGIAQFFGAGSELIGMLIFAVLIRYMNSLRILKICSICFIVRFVLLMVAPNIPLVITAYALQAPSTGFYIAASVYFVNDRLAEEHQTQGQSVFYMLSGGLASCISCLVGGWLQDAFGVHTALMVCVVLSIVGAICIVSRSEKNYVAKLKA